MEISSSIVEAFDQVSKGHETNWFVASYTNDHFTVIEKSASGTGGYDEFVQQFKADKIMYGCFRVNAVMDEAMDSHPVKVVLVTWVGPSVVRYLIVMWIILYTLF